MLFHWNFNKIELIDGGALIILVGIGVTPRGIPIIAVIIIPINNAPLIFLTKRIPVIRIPIIASNPVPFVIFPRVSIVAPSSGWTIIPAPSSPTSEINNPIPTEIAFFILVALITEL